MKHFPFILVAISLVAAVLLFVPGQLEIFETPKIAVVRACGLAVLAWWLASHFRRPTLPPRRLELWLALLLGTEIITTIFSVAPRLSLLGEFQQREGTLVGLGLAGLYLAMREASGAWRERWLHLVLGAGALCSVYALLQATGHDPLLWSNQSPVGSAGFIRPFGTSGHPNHLGILLAGLVGLSLSLFWDRPGSRWWAGPLVSLFLLTLLLSFSRGGWLGGSAAIVVVVLVHTSGLRSLSRRTWLTFGAAVSLLVLGLILTPWGSLLAERFTAMLHPATGSTRSRMEIWLSALALFRSHFWLGSGPDTFALLFPQYQTPDLWLFEWNSWPLHAHNLPLHVACTRGIVGLALLGLIAAEVLRRSRMLASSVLPAVRSRAWLAALTGIFVASLFGSPTVVGVLLMLLALAEIPGGRIHAAAKPLAHPHWILAFLILAGGFYYGTLEYRASHLARSALTLRATDPAGAADQTRASVQIMGWDEYLQRNHLETLLLALQADNIEGLRQEALEVGWTLVQRCPLRAQNHQRLGTTLLASVLAGDQTVIPQMRSEFARAAELAPWNGLFVSERARALRLAGFPTEGLALLQPMAEHYKLQGRLWAELAEVQLSLGLRNEARRSLRRALVGKWEPDSLIRTQAIERLLSLESWEPLPGYQEPTTERKPAQ